MATIRSQRMIDSAPDYYQDDRAYEAIQQGIADEFDYQAEQDDDLGLQLNPLTATWGIKYHEAALGIPIVESDPIEVRRGRVVAKRIGEENFSAGLLKRLAQPYGAKLRVYIDVVEFLVTITFENGIPSYLEEYQGIVENVIHAHLEAAYAFEYHISAVVQLRTEFDRWVYEWGLLASETQYCGTYPYIVMGQYDAETEAGLVTSSVNVFKNYNVCSETAYCREDGLL